MCMPTFGPVGPTVKPLECRQTDKQTGPRTLPLPLMREVKSCTILEYGAAGWVIFKIWEFQNFPKYFRIHFIRFTSIRLPWYERWRYLYLNRSTVSCKSYNDGQSWMGDLVLSWVHFLLPGYPPIYYPRVPGYPFTGSNIFPYPWVLQLPRGTRVPIDSSRGIVIDMFCYGFLRAWLDDVQFFIWQISQHLCQRIITYLNSLFDLSYLFTILSGIMAFLVSM